MKLVIVIVIVRVTLYRNGTTGSALMGHCKLHVVRQGDRGTFGVFPLIYFYFPKSAGAYLFPQSDEFLTFSAAPLVLTPFVHNQKLGVRQGPCPAAAAPGGVSALETIYAYIHIHIHNTYTYMYVCIHIYIYIYYMF